LFREGEGIQADESSQTVRAVVAVAFCFLAFVNVNLPTDFCSSNIVGCDIQYGLKCGN